MKLTEKQKLVLEAFDELQDLILEIEAENEDLEFTSNVLVCARMDIIGARTRMVELFHRGVVRLP